MMKIRMILKIGLKGAVAFIAGSLFWLGPVVTAQVVVDNDDIGGVVRSSNGP